MLVELVHRHNDYLWLLLLLAGCVVALSWVAQESVIAQLLPKWLNKGVNSRKGNISEISEVFTDWHVERVGAVEDIGIGL